MFTLHALQKPSMKQKQNVAKRKYRCLYRGSCASRIFVDRRTIFNPFKPHGGGRETGLRPIRFADGVFFFPHSTLGVNGARCSQNLPDD